MRHLVNINITGLTKQFNPYSLIALTESQLTFNFPEPADSVRDKRLTLWSTFYFIHQAKAINAADAIALRDPSGGIL